MYFTHNISYDSLTDLNKNICKTSSSNLKILQLNVRSVRNPEKFDRIREILALYVGKIDVLVLGETWLTDGITGCCALDGFKGVFSCRNGSLGGGLAVYVRDTLVYEELLNEKDNGFHHLYLRLKLSGESFDIHAVYRPPSYSTTVFLQKLESWLVDGNVQKVLVGDVNIPANRIESGETQTYVNLLNCYNFSVTNTIPTRPVSGNILDHVVCSESLQPRVINETIFTDISDHSIVLSSFNLQSKTQQKILWKNIVNHAKLNEDFGVALTNMQAGTPNERLEYTQTIYNSLKEQNTRRVECRARIKGDCPWMTFDLWKLLKIKENVLAGSRKRPHDSHQKELLAHISKKLRKAKEIAKKQYYEKLFSNGTQKETWRNINQLIGRKQEGKDDITLQIDGQLTADGPSVANAFNKFFSTIGPQLASTISSRREINKFGTLRPKPDSIFLRPTTAGEVVIKINELDTNKSCGPDGLSAMLIKTHHQAFSQLLRDVFNDCIKTGIFPPSLKTARVIPIHKAGSKTDVNNYRPISVLSVLSKILEQLLVGRITDYLLKKKLLYTHQYGFRTGSSTLTAAIELVDEIYEAFDERKIVGVCFLDLRKAFDTIDHDVLLKKLDCHGVRGKSNDLIKDYLTDRKQYVVTNGACSDVRGMSVGVPQGSNLGPLLFLVYINDLYKLKLHGKPRLFADDTSLSYVGIEADSIVEKMTEDLNKLLGYFAENVLSLNLSKTNFMLFHTPHRTLDPYRELIVNSTRIEEAETFKYLGLIFDRHLKWTPHIKCLQRSLSSTCGLLWKVSKYVPTKQLVDMYHAFVQSKLQYLVSIWGNAAKTALKPLQSTQNRCLKAVFRKPRLHATLELFNDAPPSILPVLALSHLQSLLQVHNMLFKPKAHHNQSLEKVNHKYTLRSKGNLVLKRPRTEAGKTTFAYQAKKAHNALPANLKSERNFQKFKGEVKVLIRSRLSSFLI